MAATTSPERAPNPQWEKAREALEKLQGVEKDSKGKKDTTEVASLYQSSADSTVNVGSTNYPMQPFMYGPYGPPLPYGYGGMYPRMPPPPPGPPPQYMFNVPPPPPMVNQNNANVNEGGKNQKEAEVKDQQNQSPHSAKNPAPFNNSFDYTKPQNFRQNYHPHGFDRGGRFPRSPGIRFPRFNTPPKSLNPGSSFQFGSGNRLKRWPNPENSNYSNSNLESPTAKSQQQKPFWAFGDDKKEAERPENQKRETSKENEKPGKTPEKAVSAEWPPNLKAYVQRCFASAISDSQKDQIEKWLKEKLTGAFNSGTVNTVNWDLEPLPDFLQSNGDKSLSHKRDHRKPYDSRHKRGSFQGYGRKWSPPGFHARSRSRSRSPYYKKERSDRRRGKSRSHSLSSDFTISSDDDSHSSHSSDRIPFFTPKAANNKGRGRGKSVAKRSQGRGKGIKSVGENISFGKKSQKRKKEKTKDKNGISNPFSAPPEKLNKRAARFADSLGKVPRNEPLSLQINVFKNDSDDDMDWNEFQIIGTSQELEKNYFRLTSAPAPSQVRPVEVLKKSLTLVKNRWKSKHDYRSTCDALKSIRQDLTVQCVRSEFVVQVYEVHARVALEKGDREEFNQCQTQLKALYNELSVDGKAPGNCLEFTAYRILYNIFVQSSLSNTTELTHLTNEMKKDPCIKFALQICEASNQNNYRRIFKLAKDSPKMSSYLIDWFKERLRKDALKCIIKSYRPTGSVEFVQSTLGFSSREACVDWLKEKGVCLIADDSKFDGKTNMGVLSSL